MKKNIFRFSFALVCMLVLYSCTVTKSRYSSGYLVEWKPLRKASVCKDSSNQIGDKWDELTHSKCIVVGEKILSERIEKDNPPVMANYQESEISLIDDVKTAPLKWRKKVITKNSSIRNLVNLSSKAIESGSKNEAAMNSSSDSDPDGISWLVYIGMMLFIPIFGGPIFIMIWTATKNNEIDWKAVFFSFVMWMLCLIPGLIYDIQWIKKNCEGSLF